MTAARSGRASGIPLSRSGHAENIPPEACFGDALAPIGRQRLSLGLSLPAAAGIGAAAERWGRGAWCGSGFLQSGAARGFIGGWRGASRVWGMRGFGKSRLVLSGKCRIAAILPLPKVFGSGLPQSCRFPKSLAPDCCNPAVSRRVWLRIAAILSFPEEFGSGLLQSCRFQPGTARISGNPRKNLPEMAGALKKSLTFRLPAGRVCRLSIS